MSDNFKLPGSSYEEIVKIIKAYASGKQGQSMSLDLLRQSTGIDKSNISRNNGFLIQLEIITSGKIKAATDVGFKLGRAYTHGINDEIKHVWLEIIENDEFLSRMLSAIKIRGGMDRTSFISHILYSAGTNPNANSKAGANTIIEIFKLVELINEVDGKLQINHVESAISKETCNEETEYTTENKEPLVVEHDHITEIPAASNMQVKLNINVNLDSNNFDEMTEKIIALIEKLKI